MKFIKRNQKYISIFLSVLLIAVFLCVPYVSAADDYFQTTISYFHGDTLEVNMVKYHHDIEHFIETDWNDLPSVDSTYAWEDPTNSLYNGCGAEWRWPTGDTTGIVSFCLGRSRFGSGEGYGNGFSSSDTIWTEPFQLAICLPEQYTGTTYFRICFRDVTEGGTIGTYVGTSGWHSQFSTSNPTDTASYWVYDIPSYEMKILKPGDYYGLSVHIEFMCNSMNSMSIGLSDGGITINYGRGSSPNYPIYPSPDTGAEDDFFQQGDEIIDDYVNDGFDAFKEEFNNFVVPAEMLQGLTVVSRLTTLLVSNIPGMSVLVMFSLLVGTLACALGLAGSIVGAASRLAGSLSDSGHGSSSANRK